MLAVISDSHFWNGFRGGVADSRGVSARLLEIERVHLDFVRDCVARRVKVILHGGDLYHRRNPTQLDIHHSLSWIELAVEADIKVVLVPGNHDYNYIQHAMAMFERPVLVSSQVKLVLEPTILEIQDTLAYAIPFMDPARIIAREIYDDILSLPEEGIVFGHAQTDHSVPGIEHGFNEREPFMLESAILKDTKPLFLLGHVHDRQEFVLGSCMCLSFGDQNNKFYWVGENGLKGEFVPVKQTGYHTVVVDLEQQSVEDSIAALDEHLKGFVRLKIMNADPYFKFDADATREMLKGKELVQHTVVRRDAVPMSVVMNDTFSLGDTLQEWQIRHGYENTEQAVLEREILTEAEHA